MTEEERDPELVRLRSKLADAIETLLIVNTATDDDEALLAGLQFSHKDWVNARGCVEWLGDYAFKGNK